MEELNDGSTFSSARREDIGGSFKAALSTSLLAGDSSTMRVTFSVNSVLLKVVVVVVVIDGEDEEEDDDVAENLLSEIVVISRPGSLLLILNCMSTAFISILVTVNSSARAGQSSVAERVDVGEETAASAGVVWRLCCSRSLIWVRCGELANGVLRLMYC